MADAGPDRAALVGRLVTLDGRGSHDPDGHIPLAFGWRQVGGPPVTLDVPEAIMPSFIAPGTSAVLTFTLAVTDAYGLADPTPDEAVVIVRERWQYIYLPLVMRR